LNQFLVALCIASGEDTESYQCSLQSILNTLETLHPNQDIQPKFFMADFSPAISAAIDRVCPQSTQLKCNFHFLQLLNPKYKIKELFSNKYLSPSTIPLIYKDYFNVHSYLNKKKTNMFSPSRIVKYDISILTKIPTKSLFNCYFDIITPFWQKYCPRFLTMFKEEYLEGCKKAGWQYYLSLCLPKTNNNVESYNRTIKDFVTKRKTSDFTTYYELMKKEVVDKSKITENLPCCPNVLPHIYKLGVTLAKNFDQVYLKYNDCYYIKDKFPNYSFLNKKKRGLKTNLKLIVAKVGQDAEATSNFMKIFSQPKVAEISKFETPGIMDKSSFLNICKIRKISQDQIMNTEFPLLSFKCTCSDYREVSFCIHIIGILLKFNHINGDSFIKKKKRGRPPIIKEALGRDSNDDNR